MFSALIVVGFAASVTANEWQVVPDTSATTLVGVGADTDANNVAGCASNGVGAFMQRWNGNGFKKELFQGGMVLDAATEGDLTVATGMLPIAISTDGGKTYTPSETLGGISQSVHIANGVITAVGQFMTPVEDPTIPILQGTDGVARSSDKGLTWSVSPVPASYSRYGAFPSENVWYVSGGHWPYDSAELALDKTEKRHRLTARVHVSERGVTHKERLGTRARANATSTSVDDETGFVATISKTVDGGVTWTTVFQSDLNNDYFYFNAIDCSSETHCVAVAEGDANADGGNDARAYVTFDGGATWTNAIPRETWPEDTELVSIMGASWVSETEGWLGATAKNRGALTGIFFHTTDGGKTYNGDAQVPDCFALDMDFADTIGLCACSNSAGTACNIGMYV